eukprot:NODE_147_length_15617_cov_0.576750.p4 type:complete len:313 gc:universal NODE_147_length_15617_cov_0.576750:9656-8718(-)
MLIILMLFVNGMLDEFPPEVMNILLEMESFAVENADRLGQCVVAKTAENNMCYSFEEIPDCAMSAKSKQLAVSLTRKLFGALDDTGTTDTFQKHLAGLMNSNQHHLLKRTKRLPKVRLTILLATLVIFVASMAGIIIFTNKEVPLRKDVKKATGKTLKASLAIEQSPCDYDQICETNQCTPVIGPVTSSSSSATIDSPCVNRKSGLCDLNNSSKDWLNDMCRDFFHRNNCEAVLLSGDEAQCSKLRGNLIGARKSLENNQHRLENLTKDQVLLILTTIFSGFFAVFISVSLIHRQCQSQQLPTTAEPAEPLN